MPPKDEDKKVKSSDDLLQEKREEIKENAEDQANVLPLGELNEELNPTHKIAEESKEKDDEDKTEQEKFVEGKDSLNAFHETATSGGLSTSQSGPSGAKAGLADEGAEAKEIFPPESIAAAEPSDDDENFDVEEPEEVPFEPVNDEKAAHHGTHDAAVFGLHTDLSGTYVPPALAKAREDEDAEAENQERLRRAEAQRREMAYDSGLRHDRRF